LIDRGKRLGRRPQGDLHGQHGGFDTSGLHRPDAFRQPGCGSLLVPGETIPSGPESSLATHCRCAQRNSPGGSRIRVPGERAVQLLNTQMREKEEKMETRMSHFGSALTLVLALGVAGTASAGSVSYRASGSIPLPQSANDFHVRIAIPDPAVVGDPINFSNGPWGTDGTVTHSGASFTVDWVGSLVTSGGPYDFGFDFTSDKGPVIPVPEAWWTLDGKQVGPNYGNFFEIRELPALPEPSSVALLGSGLLLLLLGQSERRRPLRSTT